MHLRENLHLLQDAAATSTPPRVLCNLLDQSPDDAHPFSQFPGFLSTQYSPALDDCSEDGVLCGMRLKDSPESVSSASIGGEVDVIDGIISTSVDSADFGRWPPVEEMFPQAVFCPITVRSEVRMHLPSASSQNRTDGFVVW